MLAAPAWARPPLRYGWAPKPLASPYVAPNRPHWKLSALLAAHAGRKSWSQTLVRDPAGLTGRYIQMAPGEKTRRMFYADSLVFWIVEKGRMQVTIQGQKPFVASKGFIVQVPPRTVFAMQTVGAVPSLRFEVTHTRSPPSYPAGEAPPPPAKGLQYVRVAYRGDPVPYGKTKPYLDFEKMVAHGDVRTGGVVRDGETAANLIRGPAVPRPPDSDPGHFHVGTAEFWFVLEGEVDFLIEGVPYFAATQGDIVYAPAGRWHRTSFGGKGMATRLSIHPIGAALANLAPGRSAAAR